MLLAIDVGNTQTVVGLYQGERLVDHWRGNTVRSRTADELAVELAGLLALRGHRFGNVDATVVSSGVPQLTLELCELARTHLGHEPVVVGPGIKTGLPLTVDNPHEVGSDRVANCVAALARFDPPLVVVDFGTAITFDAVSAGGEFVGGAIAPGIEVSMRALGDRAARLFTVELLAPARAIGTNTVTNMQSGAIFGCASLVDGMVARIRAELGGRAATIATGGLAAVVVPHCSTVEQVEPWLTLDGLRLIWERNEG